MLKGFKFVIVGSGNISRTYANAIDQLDSVSVVGLVSRQQRRPEHFTEGIPVFSSLSAVNLPFDAVILCTPNGLHHQGAIEAAQLGKHVLTEKTLEINPANMDAMMDACRNTDVKLAVSYQRRMSPDNIVIKKLLETDVLGKVFAADMRVKFYRDMDYYNSGPYRGCFEIDGGGPFMQQAAHNVDIFCWFFGMPLSVVSMLGTFAHDIEVEDHGVALMRYENGMIGTLTASSATRPGFPPVFEIHTDKGTVIMENDEIKTWAIEGMENPSQSGAFQVHSGSNTAAVADTSGHEAILKDFVDAIRENREPAVPASSARLATELVLRIYDSNIT
jgi:predicted dehydrogenase